MTEEAGKKEVLTLTLVRQEAPVTLTLVDGIAKDFVLRELTGKGRDEYLNSMAKKMKFGPDGTPKGIQSFDGLQASLLSKCLYDEENNLVPIADIQAYPATAQAALFRKAQELSALNDEGEAETKNG